MAIYSLSQRTSQTTAANAGWEIITTSAQVRPALMEFGFTQVTGVAGTYGFGRPQAKGITPTTPQTFLAEDPGEVAGNTQGAVAWSTGPTIPANFARRITCPATIGAGVIWTFPRGYIISNALNAILWILATCPVLDIYAVTNE
jgi:hypothetical protein